MSRKIRIFSEQITEIDLADEVIQELGINSLKFNHERQCFENTQYDDSQNDTIKRASDLYYSKRRAINIEKVNAALKRNNYQITLKSENNKTKIVAVQRVYR